MSTHTKDPAFPCVTDTLFYEGISKFKYFATHAPAVPDWFRPLPIPNNFTDELWDQLEESRYWAWRKYFAEKIAFL